MVVRSDNGTNLSVVTRTSSSYLCMERQADSRIHSTKKHRVLNPSSGSHFGFVWEQCLRTVRKVLNALIKEQTLDDEGLTTMMCEVESIVNGRPITKSSDDPSDSKALTPNHLLLPRSSPKLPSGSFSKDDTYSRKRSRQVQYFDDVFWRLWSRECLPPLQKRQKWIYQSCNFAVNNIVLVVDNRVP